MERLVIKSRKEIKEYIPIAPQKTITKEERWEIQMKAIKSNRELQKKQTPNQ